MTQKNTLTFEEASKKLDSIIAKLENGSLPLDQSVALYEEAFALIEICEKHFNIAKGRLTVIENGLEKILEQN